MKSDKIHPHFQNLSGQKFGRWTVTPEFDRRRSRHGDTTIYWKVICGCDAKTEKWVLAQVLTKGKSKSCGCLWKERLANRFRSLAGQTFGRLTVTPEWERRPTPRGSTKVFWKVICNCPERTVKWVSSHSLITGGTRSCGCLMKDYHANRPVKYNGAASKGATAKQKHIYSSWSLWGTWNPGLCAVVHELRGLLERHGSHLVSGCKHRSERWPRPL
jgi:hypothetical protein